MSRGPGRGLQSVTNGIWFLKGGVAGWGWERRKRQKGGAFPFGLIISAAAPFIGEVVKLIFKKNFGRGRRKRKYRRR